MLPASRLSSAIVWLASVSGLVLSVMSALNICNSACTDASHYRIFGLDFGWFGVIYFSALMGVLSLRQRFTWAGPVGDFFIFAAAGAELRFLWLQKYVIGRWCPLCLSIAATIYVMALVVLVSRWAAMGSRRKDVRTFVRKAAFMTVALVVGLTGALVGVRKNAEAVELNMFLGRENSSTVVYFVTDWFCPACRRTEPEIASIFKSIAGSVKVGFVDIPVHPETSNFTPYNTQFLVYEKGKYLQLRQALNELAKETKTPSADDVQRAVAPYGVKLRTMNYADIAAGMNWNESIFRTYEIRATPTVVVANAKTGKHVTLVGEKEISYQGVLKAISDVGR